GNAGSDAEVSRILGIAYFNTGDKERARPHLDNALASGSRDKEVLKLTGYLRFDQGDYKGTVEALSQAEIAGIKEEDLFRCRGLANYNLGKFAEAIIDLEKMKDAGGSLATAEALALSLVEIKKEKEALPYLEKAATLKSTNASVYFE